MNNIFSIIMPCYNSEQFVENALKSIVNQSSKNWELIAINDGSTDKTLDILNSYASKDNRIHVYSKENGGYCSAVNLGLSKVTGDYFTMLGSDDCLDTNIISEIEKYIAKYEMNPDFISFGVTIRKNNKTIGVLHPDRIECYLNSTIKDFENKYGQQIKDFMWRDTARMYKTSLLGNLRYFGKYGINSDDIFSGLYSHKSHSFLCVPFDGYIWNNRDDSVANNQHSYDRHIDRINIWLQYFDIILKMPINEITEEEKNWIICLSRAIRYFPYYDGLSKTIKSYKLIRKGKKVLKKALKQWSLQSRYKGISYFFLFNFPVLTTLIRKSFFKNSFE